MDGSLSDDILGQEGFRRIGQLTHRLRLEVWWRAEGRVQLILLPLGSKTLLKGSKSYAMKSISAEGETYARDVNLLHDYLEAHFPEMHIAFSFFRDVPAALAAAHLGRSAFAKTFAAKEANIPTVDELAQIQRQLNGARRDVESLSTLAGLDSGGGLLGAHLNKQIAERRRAMKALTEVERQRKEGLRRHQHLQREYLRKGSAASFTFSVSSNLQVAQTPSELRDAARSAVKELIDLHRHQITQKLNGGRLNIHVEECEAPLLTWIEEWTGGALSPGQLERLEPEFSTLREAARSRLMVTADDDVKVDGHVAESRKLLGARVVSTLIRRLDRAGSSDQLDVELPLSAMPLRLGRLMRGGTITGDDCVLPLLGANHIYASGTTGSGKSYLGRVIVEEAANYKNFSVLILDPRNQSAGLLIPEDRSDILALYPRFDLAPDQARGFRFTYIAPGSTIGKLPSDLGSLGVGRWIVSFKGLDDMKRCDLFADILDAVFARRAESESEHVELLVVIEEAHRFTKKRVDASAKSAAARAENALDRLAREGRKFGCCALILSQTVRDFAYDSASVRQNTNTKIFMRNSDREIEYASDFIQDAKRLVALPPGAAIGHHPALGVFTFQVRPPFSKVWEFDPAQTRRLVDDPGSSKRTVSAAARELLSAIERRGADVNVTELCDLAGITSKRRVQALLKELEDAELIRSRRLRSRGAPRVIEPIASGSAVESRTELRTNGGLKELEADAMETAKESAR